MSPCTSLDRPLLLQKVEAPRISKQGGKVASPTHRLLYPSGDTPGTRFCQRVSRPQGHRAAGRSKAMINPSDPNGNRARDLPACSALPLPNTPLRTL